MKAEEVQQADPQRPEYENYDELDIQESFTFKQNPSYEVVLRS